FRFVLPTGAVDCVPGKSLLESSLAVDVVFLCFVRDKHCNLAALRYRLVEQPRAGLSCRDISSADVADPARSLSIAIQCPDIRPFSVLVDWWGLSCCIERADRAAAQVGQI